MIYQYLFLKTFFLANNKYHNYLKWSGTIFMMVAAFAITISIQLSLQSYIFGFFLISHIIWTFSASILDDKPLFALNISFIPLDIYGMFIRIQ